MAYCTHSGLHTCTCTCRCAQVKRQREKDKGKHIKMEFQPSKAVTVEFTGYKAEELGTAFESMGRSPAFTAAIDMPDHKKRALVYKKNY